MGKIKGVASIGNHVFCRCRDMAEPRYFLIDTETGRRVEITTDELQALLWRMELRQPCDGAYFETIGGHQKWQQEQQQNIPQEKSGLAT